MLRLPACILALLLTLLLSLAAAVPAHAHAQLLSSSPAPNVVLREAPEAVTLTFNEPVTPLVISLVTPDGRTLDLTGAATAGTILAYALPAVMQGGTHVLSWRVVSADSHPIAGSVIFSLGVASGTGEVATAPDSSRATSILLWISKVVLLSGFFLGVGGAVFGLVAPLPRPARRIAALLGLVGLVIAPLSLGLHGVDALGQHPDAMLLARPWSTGFATQYGVTVLMLVAALALAVLALIYPRLFWLAWPAWLLGAMSLAVSNHAAAASPQWLTRIAVTLHIGGILFWAGALLPLWFLMRQRERASDQALRQFSRLIPFVVGAILVSGIILAVVQMGPSGPAWQTPYGYVLLAKLGLLLVLFLIALWNRYRLTGPILLGELEPRLQLERAILVELVLVLGIFGLTAGWRFTPPPRAIAAATAAQAALSEPAYAHIMTETMMADISATPGRAGPVNFELYIVDAEGEPITAQSVILTFAAPALGIEPFTAEALPDEELWRLDQTIPLSGTWDVTLDIRLSRFSQTTLSTQIDFLN